MNLVFLLAKKLLGEKKPEFSENNERFWHFSDDAIFRAVSVALACWLFNAARIPHFSDSSGI
jgi:hypothetical protein